MPIKWIPTTEERYDEMLGILPPAAYGHNAFQVGEAIDNRHGQPTFASFKFEGGSYFESEEALTFREFAQEVKGATYHYGD